MPNLKLKIDITKIRGAKHHESKGREWLEITDCGLFHGKNGTIYLDLVAWENREGIDDYGNSHGLKQDFQKEVREAMMGSGEKSAFVGNGKPFDSAPRPKDGINQPYSAQKQPTNPIEDDDIPF